MERFHPSHLNKQWQKDAVIRGLVYKRFPRQDTVQLLIGKTIVTAELKAALDLGKTYWFQIDQTGATPALQVVTHGGTFDHLLTHWGIRANRFILTLLAFFVEKELPLTYEVIKTIQEMQKQRNLAREDWRRVLFFLKEKHLPLTVTSIRGTIALMKGNQTIAEALSETAEEDAQLKQFILQMKQREAELLQHLDYVNINALLELADLQQNIQAELKQITNQGVTNLAHEQLCAKLALFDLLPNAFPDGRHCFLSICQTDWSIHFPVGEASEEVIDVHLHGALPEVAALLVHIRLKEKQIFVTVRSSCAEPSAFSAAKKMIEDQLTLQGYTIAACTWIKQDENARVTSFHTGVDMRL